MRWLLMTANKFEGLYDEKFETHPSFKWLEVEDNFNPNNYIFEEGEIKSRNFAIEKDINVGDKIVENVFATNPYAQLSLIRKSLWALNVLRKETSTPEEIAQAEAILQYAESLDAQIQNILDEHYPEEYQEEE